MSYRFYTADVFTTRRFSGNQLAVFPDAQGLSDDEMQQITREFNLSETVFVFPPEDPAHQRRLRIFTPARELPFAGHPTVGAAIVLAELGVFDLEDEARVMLEEGVGPVPVLLRALPGQPMTATFTAAAQPSYGPPAPSAEALIAALGLASDDLLGGPYLPAHVSCGVPFLIVPVRDRVALAKARPDLARWDELIDPWAPEVYLIAFDADEPAQIRARMFAPSLGILEDPATGAAATALGGYLSSRVGVVDGTCRWLIEQGVEMGRPSLIELEVDLDNGQPTAIRVGGSAVIVSEGVFLL